MEYRNLLLIGCSDKKDQSSGLLPAIDRYDGPTYRILRKLQRDGEFPSSVDIRIVSAMYAAIHPNKPICDYDLRLTAERAEMIKPWVQAELRMLFSLNQTRYYQVFIHLGKTYGTTLDGFHWGLVSTVEASGGIGQKNSQMKAWLERLFQEEQS